MRDPVYACVLVAYTMFLGDRLKKIKVTEPKVELNQESNTYIFKLFCTQPTLECL